MKKVFLYAIIMAATVSCNKMEPVPVEEEEPVPEVKMITETLTGGRDIATKVTIDNTSGAFAWTAGDNIAVHVSNGESHKYVFTSDPGASGASVAEATASFTVAYEEGYARDAFAVFPSTIVSASAANYGQSGSALDVTLPASYTLAQLTGVTSPCPMIATNDPSSSSWDFKQICGMLRLTVNGIPADATGLIIQFPGKKVNGSFAIASPVTPGTSTIATTDSPADGEDKITITFDPGITTATVNIPLPTGDYSSVYVSSVGGATKVVALHYIKAGGYTAARARAKKLTTTMDVLPVVTRSDGGDVDELMPYLYSNGDIQYDFTSPDSDPAKITIDGNSTFRFYFDTDPAVVTLTGSGNPVSATWTGHNAFIESDDDLTIILDCNYFIDNSFNYTMGIECGGNLKLATTGGIQTLTVVTNSKTNYGIYGVGNYDAWIHDCDFPNSNITALAADGFTVSCPGFIDNDDGTYTWVYTITPRLYTVVAGDIGKVIGANSEIYDTASDATTAGTSALAMVAYAGSIDGVCDHGLAISLTDAYGYNAQWSGAQTVAIPEWAAAHPMVGGTWRLPSMKDWQYMMWGYYADTPVAAPVGTIKSILSDGYYWTSTEIDNANANGIYYDGSSYASVQSFAKTDEWHVRACLSF